MDNQLPDDGLRWFGEGFNGFPKRLPDDCVEYIIHVIDERLETAAAIRSRLNEILRASNEFKRKLLKGYIWQRNSFDLYLHPKIDYPDGAELKLTGPLHLQGRTNFGDSVADEWLIVYLLVELSKQFPDAWIRVYDTDGEFLLIESANALPKWLNPEIADNRVWINEGHVKIIPIKPDSDSTSQNLTIDRALKAIRTEQTQLLVDSSIEKEAFTRIRDYPSAITSTLHNALVTIPRNLAYILHENPSSISSAVESFYLRDPISLKPLNTKDLSTLTFPPEDFVTVSVKFTKVSYAQLRSQIFDAPPAWIGIIPRLRDEKSSMGMKLSCGFEMLLADRQLRDRRSVREIQLLLADLAAPAPDAPLPSDADIATWPRLQDDEAWLNIDYRDFEAELADPAASASQPPKTPGNRNRSGSSEDPAADAKDGHAEDAAHRHLRNLVSRFRDFIDGDDEADADEDDPEEDPEDEDEDEDEDEPDAASVSSSAPSSVADAEFLRAIDFTRALPAASQERDDLLAEARRLAIDTEDGSSRGVPGSSDAVSAEEVQEIMRRMEQELRGHGALGEGDAGPAATTTPTTNKKAKGKARARESGFPGGRADPGAGSKSVAAAATTKPFFGPERPPHLLPVSARVVTEGEEEEEEDSADEVGPGDLELSSDEDDEQGINDVDLNFARNMLEAFKGQTGMAGPAGNLMRALGVNGMPRDESDGGE